jgi:hypothetical protein
LTPTHRMATQLTETQCGDDEFPIGAADLLGLRNGRRCEALVAGRVTLSSIASRPLPSATSALAI